MDKGSRHPDGGDSLRPRRVLGTAGHIDHGKTALVRALTGVDTDRLPEEKARGITIDLGFAALDLPSGERLSVVDVPGHERLIRNMVAGASGIDWVLLVVAADEGVMPQTREHLAICQLLGLRRGVVALTKVDLVDEDVVELAREEVRELLAGGPLAEAPILPVSSRTGGGLDALRDCLAKLAAEEGGRRLGAALPRLWIDRSFTVRGFGTVVTGTLTGGAFETGQAVEILPGSPTTSHGIRIRGLQSHGLAVDRAEPGARTAVNLQGVDLAEAGRGRLLTLPNRMRTTESIDVEVTWLPGSAPLEGRTSVEFLSGTAERRARITPLGATALGSGHTGFARIHFDGPSLPVLPGDRFVLQGFSRNAEGGTTVGGGIVLDVAPAHRRPSDPALVRDLEMLRGGDRRNGLAMRIERSGLSGIALANLVNETGLTPSDVREEIAALEEKGSAVRAGDWCWAEGSIAEIARRIEVALAAFHRREPLRPGLPRAALAGDLPGNVRSEALLVALERLAVRGRVAVEADLVRLAEHRPELSGDDEDLASRMTAALAEAGLEPPTLKEWSERLALPVPRVRELLIHLARSGAVVQAPGEMFFDAGAIVALRERVRDYLRRHDGLETPAYKDLIGTTRKHAVPLMELFDAERLTLRVGNKRVLRGAAGTRDE